MAKKKKKEKNPIMASFPAKIGWKRGRKRENKNCISSPNRLEKAEKEKNKNYRFVSFLPHA